MNDAVFTTTKVAEMVGGVSYRRLDYWCRRGLVPGQEYLPGSGHSRVFTPEQIARIRRLTRLTNAGIDLDIASVIDHKAYDIGTARLMLLGPGLTLWMGER